MKKILLILGLICSFVTYIHIDNKVTRYELPSGEIKWTHTRPKDAKVLNRSIICYENYHYFCCWVMKQTSHKTLIGSFLIIGTLLALYITVDGGYDLFWVHNTWLYRDGLIQKIGFVVISASLEKMKQCWQVQQALIVQNQQILQQNLFSVSNRLCTTKCCAPRKDHIHRQRLYIMPIMFL